MNKYMSALMQSRGELLARIAVQREQVTEIGLRLRTPLALADRGVAAVHFLRSYPLLVAGATAFFVIRLRGVAGLVWRVWKGYRDFTSISAKLLSRG